MTQVENIIIDSRVSPFLNGNKTMMDDYNMKCTSGHKWLFSILVGLLAFIIYNTLVLYLLVTLVNGISHREKIKLMFFPSIIYSLILTVVFILILRLILW